MSGFLYFVPGVEQVDQIGPQVFEAAVVAGAQLLDRHVEHGPDGTPGLLVTLKPEISGGRAPGLVVNADTQRWTRFAGFSVGVEKAEPPRPIDLQRRELLRGHAVELGGAKWLVPAIRTAAGEQLCTDHADSAVLQAYIDLLLAGMRSQATAPQLHRRLTELAARDSWLRAVQLLSVNYRIGVVEAAALQIVTPSVIAALFGAAVDVPTLERLVAHVYMASAGGFSIPSASRN